MSSWKIGRFYLQEENNEFTVFKLLKQEEDSFLARVYWPFWEIIAKENWQLKSACTRINTIDFEIKAIDFEAITSNDEKEIVQFLKIEASKKARQSEFIILQKQAQIAYQENRFEECVQKITEAAPYAKLTLEIYVLRAKANLALGNVFEAKQDIFYLLEEFPDNEEYIELKKQLLKIENT